MRNLSRLDRLLEASARFPAVLGGNKPPFSALSQSSSRYSGKSEALTESAGLTEPERNLSSGLMRVNHVGEVCAQALYEAQACVTEDSALRLQLLQAARDERRHLLWIEERLDQLGARPSLLNPLWFGGAFGLGLVAGLAGDKISLGFVAETEKQVEAHLAGHLDRLPVADLVSRQIVEKMRLEEEAHGKWAMQYGGVVLAWPIRAAMRLSAKLMTTVARYV